MNLKDRTKYCVNVLLNERANKLVN